MEVANRDFFAFKLVFAPCREEIGPGLLGMSLATLGEVPRPVFRFSIVAVVIISDWAHFSLFLPMDEKSDQTEPPF